MPISLSDIVIDKFLIVVQKISFKLMFRYKTAADSLVF
jgi:hypothetical protein